MLVSSVRQDYCRIDDPNNQLAQLLRNALSSGDKRPEVIVKLFNPTGAGTWYVTEGEQIEGDNGRDWELFGLADIHEPELGWDTLILS
jgi:hypothetical protein